MYYTLRARRWFTAISFSKKLLQSRFMPGPCNFPSVMSLCNPLTVCVPFLFQPCQSAGAVHARICRRAGLPRGAHRRVPQQPLPPPPPLLAPHHLRQRYPRLLPLLLSPSSRPTSPLPPQSPSLPAPQRPTATTTTPVATAAGLSTAGGSGRSLSVLIFLSLSLDLFVEHSHQRV